MCLIQLSGLVRQTDSCIMGMTLDACTGDWLLQGVCNRQSTQTIPELAQVQCLAAVLPAVTPAHMAPCWYAVLGRLDGVLSATACLAVLRCSLLCRCVCLNSALQLFNTCSLRGDALCLQKEE